MRQLLVLVALLAGTAPSSGCGWFIRLISPPRPQKLPDGAVFVRSRIVNAFYQVKGNEVLLVDSGFSGITDGIMGQIKGKRVAHFVLTHADGDHRGALRRLLRGKDPPKIYLSRPVAARLRKDEKLARLLVRLPKGRLVIVSVRREVREGPFHFIVEVTRKAHTDGDLFVFLPRPRILVAGDLFVGRYYPPIKRKHGGTMLGLRAALHHMLSFQPRYVVPGHGRLGKRADLERALRFVEWVETSVRDRMIAGWDRSDIVDGIRRPPWLLKSMPRGRASLEKSVKDMYEELRVAFERPGS